MVEQRINRSRYKHHRKDKQQSEFYRPLAVESYCIGKSSCQRQRQKNRMQKYHAKPDNGTEKSEIDYGVIC